MQSLLNHFSSRQKIAWVTLALLIAACLVFVAIKRLHKPLATPGEAVSEEKISLQNNQQISVFHLPNPEKGLLIFISDNKQHRNDYARQFAQLSYTVALIDSHFLLTNAAGADCVDLATYLGGLRKELQTRFDLDQDNLPILVGEEDSGLLVYASLAQAEPNNFHAGISLNLKTELLASTKPLCQQNNLTLANSSLVPAKHLPASWYIFQEKALAHSGKTSRFTNQVNNARLTIADDPHQPPVAEAIQVLQWLDPRLTDQISSDQSDSDLPLIEVTREQADQAGTDSASTSSAPAASLGDPLRDTMAVLLTGDGGWAEIDKNIARLLADKGVPTVALDSLSYFWKTRTPVDTANDIEKVITQYREKWQKQRVILIGYSFGADVLPFIANKLTEETQQHIVLVALLGMGKTAAFEFRLSSWMDADKSANRLPLLPEVNAMRWTRSVCIYGEEDPETQCASTGQFGVKPIRMPGDHHFDEKYGELVQHIIDNAKPL